MQDVTVGCYLGREAASGDYNSLSLAKFVSYKDPLEAKLPSKDKTGKKPPAKIKYVNCQSYLVDAKEKESHKILQQIEFCSFKQMSGKKDAGGGGDPYYDDYYYQ